MLRQHLERLDRGLKMLRISVKETIDDMAAVVLKAMEVNQAAFLPTDEHRTMINVSRGPMSSYRMAFDRKIESIVVIADFPVTRTVAALAHFLDDGIHAVTLGSARYRPNCLTQRSKIAAERTTVWPIRRYLS